MCVCTGQLIQGLQALPPVCTGSTCVQLQDKAQKDELQRLLHEALTERNAARDEVLILKAKLKQLQVGLWEGGPSKQSLRAPKSDALFHRCLLRCGFLP